MHSLDQVNAKMFDARFPWGELDRDRALSNTAVLDLLRDACLIESYFPIYMAKMISLFWDDVAATSIFTIEAIEAYGHYFTLRRYLDLLGYRPVSDEEVTALREKDRDQVHPDKVRELVNFMGTEHFAAEFFNDLAGLTTEPLLRGILPRFSAEEVIHARFAYELLERMIATDPTVKDQVLLHAAQFRHVGSYVMPVVAPAKQDNLKVIRSFDAMVGGLAGKPLSKALAQPKR